MTVNSVSITDGPYVGNNIASSFDYSFVIQNKNEVSVYETNLAGTQTLLTVDTDYTVGNIGTDNGVIVRTAGPLPTGWEWYIRSNYAITQLTSFNSQGAFFPDLHESAMDKLTYLIQQVNDKISRSLRYPDSYVEGVNGASLPIPEALKLMRWRADLTGLENISVDTIVPGATVLSDYLKNVDNVTALANTAVTNTGICAYVKQHTSGNVGGGVFKDMIGNPTPIPGVVITNIATPGHYWQRIVVSHYIPEMAGVIPTDQATDFTAKINALSPLENNLELSGNINLSSASLVDLGNVNFSGDYKILNQQRKYSAPIIAPGPQPFNDVIANLQLKQLNTNYKPKIVIVGDSLSTNYANVWGRGDMTAETLRQSFEAQFPMGVTWVNMAIAGSGFSELFTTNYAATSYLPWYQGMPSTTWINVVEMQAPDVLIIPYGTNDNQYASIQAWDALNTELDTWTTRPDVVVVTNPVPSPSSTSPAEGVTGQYARDMAAGLARSYAKLKKWALVDLHRMYCMARDGFDPISACIKEPVVVSPVSNICTGTELCSQWKIRAQLNAANMVDGDSFTIATGRGSADFIILSRISTTSAGISAYGGIIVDSLAYVGTSFTFAWPTTGTFYLTIERTGNQLLIYRDDDIKNGGYYPNDYVLQVVGMGGDYYPYIQANQSNRLVDAQIGAGEYLRNKPTIKNSKLFDGSSYGGSLWNHPSGFYATNVLRPVIQNIVWKRPRRKLGYVSATAGASSVNVTFTVDEPNVFYEVIPIFTDAAPGSTIGTTTKTVSGFTFQFSPNLVFSCTILWELVLRQE